MRSNDICEYCKHGGSIGNDASVCCDRCYNHNHFDGIEIEQQLRNGEWVSNKVFNKRVCSYCGAEAHWLWTRDKQILSPYCPHCGAKMEVWKNDGIN